MKIIVQKSWASRDDLDKYVRATFGDDPAANAGISLELTDAEMQALQLDTSTTVYGLRVVQSADLGVAAASGPVRTPPRLKGAHKIKKSPKKS